MNSTSKIAITGLSGELGSFLVEKMQCLPKQVVDLYHAHQYQSSVISEHRAFDLLNLAELTATLDSVKPDWIIHLAGATHIDACEVDRKNGKQGQVWQMNVAATAAMADYCARTQTHLTYLSTECVFDGQKSAYQEADQPAPINWYGQTKAEAEQAIIQSGCKYTILRAVIAYAPTGRQTLWQKIAQTLQTKGSITMATDHWMTPTYLPDIATVLDTCLQNDLTGIYHLSPASSLSPFSFAQKIAQALGYSKDVVIPKTLVEIMGQAKAELRLTHACLNAQKTEEQLGLKFTSLDEVIKTL